eukprot:3280489-Alexandrium_andersonii.AAC.1
MARLEVATAPSFALAAAAPLALGASTDARALSARCSLMRSPARAILASPAALRNASNRARQDSEFLAPAA